MPKPERVIADRLLSTSEAAEIASVDVTTIRDWFDRGLITGASMPYGDRIVRRVSLLSLKAYLAKLDAEADQHAG